ncbi:MAG: hypothetical protein ACLQIS_18155 [Bryobacteraceae bacterium]
MPEWRRNPGPWDQVPGEDAGYLIPGAAAKKTIEIYRGMDPVPIPAGVHDRLLDALRKKSEAAPPA